MRQLRLPIRRPNVRPRGRPRTSRRIPHTARPEFAARHPLHLTLRLQPGLPKLRGKPAIQAIRRALMLARSLGLNVVHYAILTNHVHLMVESDGKAELGKQMQSLGISLAKGLNRAWSRRGQVLRERYHRVVITSALQAKHALSYVLQNESRHRSRLGIHLDAYSSAATFTRWRELRGQDPPLRLDLYAELFATVDRPRTWLLARGWRRARPSARSPA